MSISDEDGTPPHRFFSDSARERVIPELLGIVKGIICDGVVNDAELVALRQWMRSHPDALVKFPGNVLAPRLVAAFEDGVIDDEERADLRQLLMDTTGETEDQSGDMDRATLLPCDEPLPTVIFDASEFCFTGRFAFGPRAKCEAEVMARGGRCSPSVTARTRYLVIGVSASPAWAGTTHGRKIEHAMHLRDTLRCPVSIVPERHWVEAMSADA